MSIASAQKKDGTVTVNTTGPATFNEATGASVTPTDTSGKSWLGVSDYNGPIAYPGYIWGYGATPADVTPGSNKNNNIANGKIEQGVDWFAFGEDKKWRYNTFVNAYVTSDTAGYDYNNKVQPAVGMKVRRTFDNGMIDIGVQAVYQHNTVTNQNGTGAQAFASFWFGWDLKK